VGPATAAKLLDRAAGRPLAEALREMRPPAAAAQAWQPFVAMCEVLAQRVPGWPAELEHVRQWYQPLMQERFDDAMVRAGDLDQLQNMAGASMSREQFLTDLTLDPP
jgi:DNA helicase-2/ATP-dependent DNA helicase PcrA